MYKIKIKTLKQDLKVYNQRLNKCLLTLHAGTILSDQEYKDITTLYSECKSNIRCIKNQIKELELDY